MVAGVYIDEFLPYLKSTQTGEIVPTEVIRLKRKSFLRKYNFDTGWCFNWGEMEDDDEIYALVIEGTVDIQGLVAIRKDDEKKAVYISRMCTSPENNKDLTKKVKHLGVGGLLFTIAANKSIEYGYNGVMYGEVGNRELLQHYIKVLKAERAKDMNGFIFFINEKNAKKIKKMCEIDKYLETISTEYGPYSSDDFPYVLDLRGISEYAREKGVKIPDLCEEEKNRFITKRQDN